LADCSKQLDQLQRTRGHCNSAPLEKKEENINQEEEFILPPANRKINEKALRETQTLRAGCSKAGQKNFARCRSPSRGRMTAKI